MSGYTDYTDFSVFLDSVCVTDFIEGCDHSNTAKNLLIEAKIS